MNLFEWGDRYPHTPGHRNIDTSVSAAETIKPQSRVLRDKVLEYIKWQEGHGSTADEAAEYLDADILNVRPRISELNRMNMIMDSGRRRVNSKGNTQKVWVWL